MARWCRAILKLFLRLLLFDASSLVGFGGVASTTDRSETLQCEAFDTRTEFAFFIRLSNFFSEY